MHTCGSAGIQSVLSVPMYIYYSVHKTLFSGVPTYVLVYTYISREMLIIECTIESFQTAVTCAFCSSSKLCQSPPTFIL